MALPVLSGKVWLPEGDSEDLLINALLWRELGGCHVCPHVCLAIAPLFLDCTGSLEVVECIACGTLTVRRLFGDAAVFFFFFNASCSDRSKHLDV